MFVECLRRMILRCKLNDLRFFFRFYVACLAGLYFQQSIAEVPQKIYVIGSSTAAGTGASRPEYSWVGLLKPWAIKNRSLMIENRSVPGLLTESVACASQNSLAKKAIADGANYLVLSFPSNDATAGVDPELTIRQLKSVQQCASLKGIKVAVMSTLPRSGLSREQMLAIDHVDRAMRREFKQCFIDVRQELSQANGYEPRADFSAGDGVHFNDKGHYAIFNLVKNFINKKQCI